MDKRERNLLIAFGAIVVGFGFYYGLLPMYYHYQELKPKIDKNIEKIQNAQAQASRLEALVDELTETKRKLKKARQKLPERGRFRELMSKLEKQARSAGIPDEKILQFSQGQTSSIKDGMVQEMSISARFDSITMEQLVEMLWRFDNMIRMLDIKSFRNFSISRTEGNDQFLYSINMDMTVYILRDTDSVEQEET